MRALVEAGPARPRQRSRATHGKDRGEDIGLAVGVAVGADAQVDLLRVGVALERLGDACASLESASASASAPMRAARARGLRALRQAGVVRGGGVAERAGGLTEDGVGRASRDVAPYADGADGGGGAGAELADGDTREHWVEGREESGSAGGGRCIEPGAVEWLAVLTLGCVRERGGESERSFGRVRLCPARDSCPARPRSTRDSALV